jgi:hypothetical protein
VIERKWVTRSDGAKKCKKAQEKVAASASGRQESQDPDSVGAGSGRREEVGRDVKGAWGYGAGLNWQSEGRHDIESINEKQEVVKQNNKWLGMKRILKDAWRGMARSLSVGGISAG